MSANNNQIPIEVLQPDVGSQIIQTTLEELKDWIRDGKLQPHHQVRVKNLSWVEARKIPALQPFFESKSDSGSPADRLNHLLNQSRASALEHARSESENKTPHTKEMPSAASNPVVENKLKNAGPSDIFKAFEKKAIGRSRQTATDQPPKADSSLPEPPRKFSALKKAAGFIAGCVLAFLLTLGGSYLWIYQLKAPAEINEKSLPELASLEDRLTSDKLDLRLKKEADLRKLKETTGSDTALPQQPDLSLQIAQLEKQYEARRQTVIENHRKKLLDADFTMTFSFSFAVVLALFLLVRILYDKKSQPVKNYGSPKLSVPQPAELSDIAETDAQITDDEDFLSYYTKRPEVPAKTNDEVSKGQEPAEDSDEKDSFAETIYIDESSDEEESPPPVRCLIHRETPPAFACETCSNRFCVQCLKTIDETENCCPFCKTVCDPLEANDGKTEPPQFGEKKKTNLPDLGKGSNFVVYDYPEEKSRLSRIVQAFVIAVLLSTSVSIFWVYKISPYLENRNAELSQNNSPDKERNSEPSADPKAAVSELTTANGAAAETADQPCIDPETKQPFECDEETRKALYEHTRKIQSTEKAQSEVSEKTSLIFAAPADKPKPDNPKPGAAGENRKPDEVRQFIKTFGISFVITFGLLLFTVFFGRDKKSFLSDEKRS